MEQWEKKLVLKVDSTKIFPQVYTNYNYGKIQNAINIKSWPHTDYSNKNMPISTNEE